MDRYAVISADCHGGGAIDDYRPYLPSVLHDEFDRWRTTFENPYDDLQATTPRGTGTATAGCGARGRRRRRRGHLPEHHPAVLPAGLARPPAARRDDGDLALRWAGLQAHNRWLADFCARGARPARRDRADHAARRRRRGRRDPVGRRGRAHRRRPAARRAAGLGPASAVRARLRADLGGVRGARHADQPPQRQRGRPTTATTRRPR